MAIPVEMPKMSDTANEGILVAWLVDEGASVSAGDIIAQIETDKATMDLEVWHDGVLLKQVLKEGDQTTTGALVAVLGQKGEDCEAILHKYGAFSSDTVAGPERAERVKASPLARRLAKEKNIDLSTVDGTGPGGRITREDIDRAIVNSTKSSPDDPSGSVALSEELRGKGEVPGSTLYESKPVSLMRATIARRLTKSKFSAPHFYLSRDVDMGKALEFREQINGRDKQGAIKVSINDLVTRASALALKLHPEVNCSFVEDEQTVHYYQNVHVAIAMALENGLVTPVIRDTDQKDLFQIAEETHDLAERARVGTLQPADWEGSTYTTSNLGMFGIEDFTGIINPPNACLLAIGTVRETPVVRAGAVVPGMLMKMTLSCDHRIVDGVIGARFLNAVKQLLEVPSRLLLSR